MPTAELSWSLYIQCPACEKHYDLSEYDDDLIFANAIFNNKWNDLKGQEVECPDCGHEFKVDSVLY